MIRKPPSAAAIRKSRDIAVVIPIVCTLLIMPPFVHIVSGGGSVFGIPPIVVYLFGIWILAIVLTAWNARRLSAPLEEDTFGVDAQDAPP